MDDYSLDPSVKHSFDSRPKIDYAVVKTTNRYTEEPCIVVLAEALIGKQFEKKAQNMKSSVDVRVLIWLVLDTTN